MATLCFSDYRRTDNIAQSLYRYIAIYRSNVSLVLSYSPDAFPCLFIGIVPANIFLFTSWHTLCFALSCQAKK
jgi:hypothetical protein